MTRKPRDEMVLESGTHNNLLPGLIRCIQSRGPDEGDPNVSQPQQSPLKNLHQCAHPTPHHTIPRPFAPSPPSKPDLTPQNLITGSHFTWNPSTWGHIKGPTPSRINGRDHLSLPSIRIRRHSPPSSPLWRVSQRVFLFLLFSSLLRYHFTNDFLTSMTTTTMLLRSSSTPILNSCIPNPNLKDSPHEHEILHRIPPTRSLTLSASSSSLSLDASPSRMTRALSETDLPARSKTTSFGSALFSFSESDECESASVEGGGSGGGGGWDNSGGGGSGFWNSNNGNDSTDLYYRTMIEANPGNPLFLGNYARYLKEVRELTNIWFTCGVRKAMDENMYSCLFDGRFEGTLWKQRSTVGERYWRIQMMGRCCPCMQTWFGRAIRMLRVPRLILIKQLKLLLMTGNNHQLFSCFFFLCFVNLYNSIIICMYVVCLGLDSIV